MKEKQALSSYSQWAYWGFFAPVFMSCMLIWLFASVNPYKAPFGFSTHNISWDSRDESLTFSLKGEDFYLLDKEGHLTCIYHVSTYRDEKPDQFLTQEQYRSLRQRYAENADILVFSDSVIVVIVPYLAKYIGAPLTTNYRLSLLRDVNDISPIIVDAQTLYQANIECNKKRTQRVVWFVAFIVCTLISVQGIRRLRYKYLWLCAFVILLLVGFVCGYIMSFWGRSSSYS